MPKVPQQTMTAKQSPCDFCLLKSNPAINLLFPTLYMHLFYWSQIHQAHCGWLTVNKHN